MTVLSDASAISESGEPQALQTPAEAHGAASALKTSQAGDIPRSRDRRRGQGGGSHGAGNGPRTASADWPQSVSLNWPALDRLPPKRPGLKRLSIGCSRWPPRPRLVERAAGAGRGFPRTCAEGGAGRSGGSGRARARERGTRRGGCQRRLPRGQRRVRSVRSSDLASKLPLLPIKSDRPHLDINL